MGDHQQHGRPSRSRRPRCPGRTSRARATRVAACPARHCPRPREPGTPANDSVITGGNPGTALAGRAAGRSRCRHAGNGHEPPDADRAICAYLSHAADRADRRKYSAAARMRGAMNHGFQVLHAHARPTQPRTSSRNQPPPRPVVIGRGGPRTDASHSARHAKPDTAADSGHRKPSAAPQDGAAWPEPGPTIPIGLDLFHHWYRP